MAREGPKQELGSSTEPKSCLGIGMAHYGWSRDLVGEHSIQVSDRWLLAAHMATRPVSARQDSFLLVDHFQ